MTDLPFYKFLPRLLAGLLLVPLLTLSRGPAEAAELVIFESMACEWCEIWEEEIGEGYHNSSEARVAPLRRVDIDDDRPVDLEKIEGIAYTPTFVVMSKGEEVGRIIGYPGEDFFWHLLDEILAKHGIMLADGT